MTANIHEKEILCSAQVRIFTGLATNQSLKESQCS